MDPAGRHIVVTGAASGIGRACAIRFAEEAGVAGPPGGPPDLLDADWDLPWRVNVMSRVWAAGLPAQLGGLGRAPE